MAKVSDPRARPRAESPGCRTGPDRVRALGEHDGGTGEGQQAEEDVEPEDGSPGPSEDQEAADQRAQGQAQAGHGGPDAQGPRPFSWAGVEVPDHREGAGLGCGSADAHHHPTGDEDIGGRGDRGDHRASAKDGHPGEHHLLAPEEVADGAEAQHEAGEGQGVPVHHPLQLTHRGVQLTLHVGQDDGDDGVVEEGQEETKRRVARAADRDRDMPSLTSEPFWRAEGSRSSSMGRAIPSGGDHATGGASNTCQPLVSSRRGGTLEA